MTPYERELRRLWACDERVVVMTAENRAPLRSFTEGMRERFIDTGITEQTLVGAAAGLALQGRRPIVHALSAFLTMRAFEFIRTDVGLGQLPVVLVGFIPGLLSDGNGPTHQALEDVGLMRLIPGMQVFCPADAEELAQGLEPILLSGKPTYIRYTARPAKVPHSPFHWGEAEILSEGRDVTIFTYGALVEEAWGAQLRLAQKGIRARLVHLRTLVPFDEATVLESLEGAELVVTLEDHFGTGGLFGALSECCLRNRISADVLPLDFGSRWFRPGRYEAVLNHEGLTANAIADRIAIEWHRRGHA